MRTWIVTLYDGEYHTKLYVRAFVGVQAVGTYCFWIDGKYKVQTSIPIESIEVE